MKPSNQKTYFIPNHPIIGFISPFGTSLRRLIRTGIGLLSLFAVLGAEAAPPVVSNIRAAQRAGTQLVDIYYDVSDADGNNSLTVSLAISGDGGVNYNVPVFALTGAVGPGVTLGHNRFIVWNAGVDWPGRFSSQCKIKIIADDGTAPQAPPNMAYIPAGAFQMGDNLDGATTALPVHGVYLSAFFIDKYEVRRELWQEVLVWAQANGYGIASGSSNGSGHPIYNVSWYDVAKWCNARSEKEGLTPCYYTDSSQTTVWRTGETNLANACVKWTADGYRLPTEAEWEKAARGGLAGNRYPWGNSIDCANANYTSSCVGSTRPGGSYAANGYGLYDVAGNISEWIWDGYDGAWYGTPGATSEDSRGPDGSQSSRVLRGGAWSLVESVARCAFRSSYTLSPGGGNYVFIGFRCAKGL